MLNIPVLFRAIDVSHELRKSIFQPLVVLAEKFVYKRAKFISVNNESLRDHCVNYGAKYEKISVDYPGLDLERFKPETTDLELKISLGFNSDDKIILFMGTLYRFAGLPRFLELIKDTLKLDEYLKVLIIGDGEALGSIEDTILRLGLENHVVMPGFVKYDELSSYLNLADIAINTFEPGLVTDSALPWKVIQYLACGLPTISTPLRGLMAYTGDNSEAIIYRKLDSSFVDAICELVRDQNRRISLSIKARELVVYRSSWANCIVRFENLLTSLVAEK
jgi:glycosyltransferase involved in cell wall biosynthesis